MREVKFRLWYEGKYHKRFELSQFDDGSPIGVMNVGPSMTSHDSDQETILEQYTGLKDKNGVEAYQSDKIVGRDKNGREYQGVITWINEASRFDVMTKEMGIPMSRIVEFEVVGNLHESPELLK